jgi:hypothetical protein
MKTAGILKGGAGLYPSKSVATVRVQQGQTQVVDVRKGSMLTRDISAFLDSL